ncbi:hypothetical protein KC19_12G063300 [Ceratodon purpureus]|uniref:Uncharacterized protein n=1 Tax=Ceratodon purpureus TaxID=3225 RepID=A0A8T0G4Z1_CERPU|nr:hypothetical protein KC19_12G063300 [Ceratodon purpureus]
MAIKTELELITRREYLSGGERGKSFREQGLQLVKRNGALVAAALDDLPVAEHDQGREAVDAVHLHQRRIRVGLDLHHLQLPGVLLVYNVHALRHQRAWPTPCRPEVHQHRHLRHQHLPLEIALVHCHHLAPHSPHRLPNPRHLQTLPPSARHLQSSAAQERIPTLHNPISCRPAHHRVTHRSSLQQCELVKRDCNR